LIEDPGSCTITGDTTGNVTGADPLLGALTDNGGPTLTHALLTGSPAIDAAGSTGPATDQRGVSRPQGSFFDIGAYERTVGAVTIDVTTTDDELNADGDCSLREAIRAANINGPVSGCPAGDGDDTIVLPAGTYDLTIAGAGEDAALTGDLDVTDVLTIAGAGAATTIVDANDLDRVFQVIGAATTFQDLTIRDGSTGLFGGGGIRSDSTLTLERTVVTSNTVTSDGNRGGGIHAGPNTTLIDSTVSDNSGVNGGAGIQASGTLSLTDSTVSGNTEVFTSASSEEGGAGINISSGTLTLLRSSVTGNSGARLGGGIRLWCMTGVTITESTISGNQANAADGRGGGIDVPCAGNPATVVNSTISGNTAATQGGGFRGGTWSIIDSTIAGNGAPTGGNLSGTFTLNRSLVSDSTSGGDCAGEITSTTGHNLIEDTIGCTLTGTTTGNVTGVDPDLGALQDNTGPTFTHELLDGSPAIDAAGATCSATDQRGVLRPQGSFCDIGAFEAPAAGFTDLALILSDRPDPVNVGDTITYGAQVSNVGDVDATDVDLTLTLPPEVTFVSASPSQGTCDQDGGVVTCALGDVSVGDRARVIVQSTAATPGAAVANAAADSDEGEDDPDPSPNTAETTTTINGPPDDPPRSLTVQRVGNGRGSVTSQPAGISCGRDCTEVYADGATVVLRARKRTGSVFSGWGGDCASAGTNLTCTLVMDSDKTVTATFTQTT
ncbi:MAG: choice-of-anchor Q domain-containing protein, partial [Actinomycetota bacterium]